MEGKVVILGGGVAALGATYHLVKHGTHPVIIERSREIGGLASSYRIGDFYIERFYHHFFPTDTLVFDLAKELGIENKMLWKKTRMGFYHKDKLYGFTSPLDIIRFMPLSFANRVRFGLTMLKIAKTREFGNLDKLTAKEWLISTFGQEIYQEIFLPMLKIKFAMSLDKASAAFVYGRLRARAESRARNISAEKLGYMENGYHDLIDAMYRKAKGKCSFYYNTEVMEIQYNEHNYSIKTRKGGKITTITADYIINTLPLEVFAKLAKGFPPQFMENVRKIKYQAVICATIGLTKKLSDYYWINISSAELPFHGVIEHTNFIPSSHYNNNHIAYVFNYVTPEHPFWRINEKKLMKAYIGGLKRMFPDIADKDVLWHRVAKERYATPIFLQGYEEDMKSVEDFRHLYFAGSFKIYPHSRNVNNVLRTGFEAAEHLIADEGK